MSEVVDVAAYRVEICTPMEAGKYDPPMQDWLNLPISTRCPVCGSLHWGTINPRGYFLVRQCHDQKNIHCRAKFRGEVDIQMISSVVGALTGEHRRFGMSMPKDSAANVE
jgi:hypothetical protein